ncbi:MAG TPA: isochorismatase family cysteine hydrolase [Acidobacteriaceae bacterium]|jgi:nicotinamidase-related amidase
MKTAFGLKVPQTLGDLVQPSRCALVLYDMQVGIVPQIATGKEIQAQCAELLHAAREAGFRIFHTRHFFLPVAAAGTAQLRRAMVWQRKEEPQETKCFIPQGSTGFQIVAELQPRDGEVVVDKITMSAFEGTFLNLAMRDAGIDSFLIAGIALEIGIEPTVRQALDLNYFPILVTDACGSKTAELKTRSLATLGETGEVFTVTTQDAVQLLRAAAANLLP